MSKPTLTTTSECSVQYYRSRHVHTHIEWNCWRFQVVPINQELSPLNYRLLAINHPANLLGKDWHHTANMGQETLTIVCFSKKDYITENKIELSSCRISLIGLSFGQMSSFKQICPISVNHLSNMYRKFHIFLFYSKEMFSC